MTSSHLTWPTEGRDGHGQQIIAALLSCCYQQRDLPGQDEDGDGDGDGMEMVMKLVVEVEANLNLAASLRAHDFYFIFVEFPKVVDLHGLFVSCCHIIVSVYISVYIASMLP